MPDRDKPTQQGVPLWRVVGERWTRRGGRVEMHEYCESEAEAQCIQNRPFGDEVESGVWWPDGDGAAGERAKVDQLVAVIERIESLCRPETPEGIIVLNEHPELYDAVCDARALLLELDRARQGGNHD